MRADMSANAKAPMRARPVLLALTLAACSIQAMAQNAASDAVRSCDSSMALPSATRILDSELARDLGGRQPVRVLCFQVARRRADRRDRGRRRTSRRPSPGRALHRPVVHGPEAVLGRHSRHAAGSIGERTSDRAAADCSLTSRRSASGSDGMNGLPASPRILVIGTSSAGKTTLADALSRSLAISRIELDELFWSPGWKPKPSQEFLELVRRAAAGQTWVADGNYSSVRPVLWPRANVIVWLNYPLPLIFWRGLVRAIRRCCKREVLWHGNTESFRRTFFSRESILVWILTTHGRRAREFRELQQDPRHAGVAWLEFRSPADTAAWLQEVRLTASPRLSPAAGDARG